MPVGINLDSILCIKTESALRNDFTVAHNSKLYQIEDRTPASRVMVHEQIDGSIKIFYRGQALRFGEITTNVFGLSNGFGSRSVFIGFIDCRV